MKKPFSIGAIFSPMLSALTGRRNLALEQGFQHVSQDSENEFVLGEDYQYYFYLSGIRGTPLAESEDEYYFIRDGEYICSKNKKTGKIVPLCSKWGCSHGSSNCSAYVGLSHTLNYYHGKLYFYACDSRIYEMDSSSGLRKELLCLQENPSFMMVHRGYLYLSFTDYQMEEKQYTEEQMKKMCYRAERYRLDPWDGKPEIVYEKKGEFGRIRAMFAYGNWAYFIVSGSAEIVIYDLLDHTQTKIPDTIGCPAIINGNLLYFKTVKEQQDDMDQEEKVEQKRKNRMVLAKPDGTPIRETEDVETYGYLYGGSQLLAIDDSDNLTFFYFPEPGIRLYDKDMNLIREIKTKNRDMPSLGMNEDYFFYENRADNVLWVIDLHKLDDPNLKGEPFFVTEK